MAKIKTKYVCQECGHVAPRWMGKCPECGKWNTFAEEIEDLNYNYPETHKGSSRPTKITEISSSHGYRIGTGINELDRVLGGGIVQGTLILIGGDPGIGKSTLLLQVCNKFAEDTGTVFYVTGEESKEQTKIRANRLGVVADNLYVITETNMEIIENFIRQLKPELVVIDSIQTMFLSTISSVPGSVSQVRECTNRLMNLGKTLNIPIFIVGHVTKEGVIAGPRILEHMVDTVLYFEGAKHQSFRILRAVKNRFGSTNEIGVFQMLQAGLQEVENPSGLFLAERPRGTSGSAVASTLEGTRPVLIEIQALVSETPYVSPRRLSTGLELNRILLMIAVLEKRLGLVLKNFDVYLNAVGGIKVTEPAVDLGICASIVSSFKNTPIPPDIMLIGEVGLAGEIRAVPQVEARIKEAYKMGFKRVVLPYRNLEGVSSPGISVDFIGVKTIEEALETILGG